MSKEEDMDVWEEDAKARLSGIEEIAEKTDSAATKQLRKQISELIRAKAKPEQNSESKLPGERIIEVLGDFLGRLIEVTPDNEYTKILKENNTKIKAEKELQKTRLSYDLPAIFKAISTMKAIKLYQVAEDLYQGKTIEEIRNTYTPILRGIWINR